MKFDNTRFIDVFLIRGFHLRLITRDLPVVMVQTRFICLIFIIWAYSSVG